MTETLDLRGMTDAEIDAALKPARPNKWRNRRVEYEGEWFDSQGELAHWLTLKLRQQAGEVRRLNRQQWVIVQGGFWFEGRYVRPIRLRIDFWYEERQPDGRWAWVFDDFKGAVTPEYKLKWKIMQHKYRHRKDTILRLSYKDRR